MIVYGLGSISAIIIKIVDEIEDTYAGKCMLKYPLAVLYGLLLGYIVSQASFSTLWIAVIFAQLVTGKIDRISHVLGFSSALIFFSILGIYEFVLVDFFVFMLFASLDETNLFKWPTKDARLSLKLATLIYGFFIRWDYFIAIMFFDVAYYTTGKVFSFLR